MQPDSLEFWIDVNIPDILAEWIQQEYKLKATTFRELNFANTKDFQQTCPKFYT